MRRNNKNTRPHGGKKKYSNYKGKKFPKEYEASESNAEAGRKPFKTSTNPGNDPSFYSGNPDLINTAYSINFSYPAGVVQNVGTAGKRPWGSLAAGKYSVPAIVTASIIPSFGRNTNIDDALNVVAQQVYTQMRSHNSGARNYDANDLALFVLGMADVYSYINYLIRLYAIITMPYEPMNRAVPRYLCEANHADYDDLIGQAAQFRYSINLLIDKVSSFIVPSAFKLFLRRASIYSKCFIESESVRDQIYMYVPEAFYRFTLDGDKAGKLALTGFAAGRSGALANHYTMSELVAYGNMLINDYFIFNDSALISGDLEKAFGTDIYRMQHMPDTVELDFTTDSNVLNQFKNATPLCISFAYDNNSAFYRNFDVTQSADKGVLETKPYINCRLLGQQYRPQSMSDTQWEKAMGSMYDLDGGQQIFSFESPVPTTDDIIEATRLHFAWELSPVSESSEVLYLYPGSEIVNNITVWYPDVYGGNYASIDLPGEFPLYGKPDEDLSPEQVTTLMKIIFSRRSMKWLPKLNVHHLMVTGSNVQPEGIDDPMLLSLMQITNFTYVDQKVLKRMHESVLIDQLFIKYI